MSEPGSPSVPTSRTETAPKKYSLREWAPDSVTVDERDELENEKWEVDSVLEGDYSNAAMLKKLEAIPTIMRALIRKEFSVQHSMFVDSLPELFYGEKDNVEVGKIVTEFLRQLRDSEDIGNAAESRAIAGRLAAYIKSL